MIDAPHALRFHFADQALVVVPVRVGERECRFLVDSAAGLDLVSESLAEALALENTGRLTAQRCTGEEITLALSRLDALELGPLRREDLTVGITDLLDRLPPELGSIDGALSLRFFEEQPFTLDYPKRELVLESAGSLATRAEEAEAVCCEPRELEQTTLDLFVPVLLEGEHELQFEVDTGATRTLVSDDWIERLGIDRDSDQVDAVDGISEHGTPYTAFYGEVQALALRDAPDVRRDRPRVCFKPLIHDGVLGKDFLEHFVVTFDVPGSRILLAPDPDAEDSADALEIDMGAGVPRGEVPELG